jgi:PAS domain S-box-containing protein
VNASEQEVKFERDELIVSKTDLHGNITYANRIFMRISNYSEVDLLGQPHNFIRHQDMPRGVFYGLWKTLKAGGEFFGFIKNQTADGNYYWVFANITPDYHHEKIIGFYSVRRCPPVSALADIVSLYQQMKKLEQNYSKEDAPKASWEWLQRHCQETAGVSYETFVLSHYQSHR